MSGTSTYVNNTDYDASGRVDVRDLGGPAGSPVMRVDYTYFNWTDANGQGRLKQITSGIMSDTDSLQDLRYPYDANGNGLPARITWLAARRHRPLPMIHWTDCIPHRQVEAATGLTASKPTPTAPRPATFRTKQG